MGLFVRKHTEQPDQPLYTTSRSMTVLFVGLGNIGKEYEHTRHNIGFECLDTFARQHDFPAWIEKKDLKCLFTKQLMGDTQIVLIKPTTFMNESGQAVQAVQRFYKLTNNVTVVVHDELDVRFGQIRMRTDGGHAGNNGVRSIISHCGSAFHRIRIGIQNDSLEHIDSSDFVLARFSKKEQEAIPLITREVSAILSEFTASGELPHDTRNLIT